ncbi:FkbM family methyltransferase [Gimesia sp.]|uniref:FkbM family methyltransferase n=1 Tax=Gimesia sp. TaxID=2024833 RepID=UPI003A93BDAA
MNLSQFKLKLDTYKNDFNKSDFCANFLQGNQPRYILGRNFWARSIANEIDVDGFVDDFTSEEYFLDKPILKVHDVPENALIISANVLGRPITVKNKLIEHNLQQIDYFAFRKYSGLTLEPVLFWDEFLNEFKLNRDKFDWIYSLLADQQSRTEFSNLINFRLSSDLSYMEDFADIQYRQYFEDFLQLQPEQETFLDVGCFDGKTSLEFIKRCADYAGIHVFEPEPENMINVKQNLAGLPNITFHDSGLSNQSQTLRFSVEGSSSKVSNAGDILIIVERLDDLIHTPFTFLKMDIEGEELSAIEGAKESIIKHHPKLAICVYHRPDDFWKIPELILSFRSDYKVYLRHYTEGVTETVMFFIPSETANVS